MKKIYISLLSFAAIFCFAPSVSGQGYTHTYDMGDNKTLTLTFPNETNHNDYGDNESVGVSKHISSPVDGKYWIKLETFARGESMQISSNKPADIVLALDMSSSMNSNNYTTGTDGIMYEPVNGNRSGTIDGVQRTASYSYQLISGYTGNNQRYISFHGAYPPVYAGRSNPSGGGYYYLYFEADGQTYYLDGTQITTVCPTKYTANGDPIWEGTLFIKRTSATVTRLRALKEAVAEFLEVIYQNDVYEGEGYGTKRAQKLGNRISIVVFSDYITNGTPHDANNVWTRVLVDWTDISTTSGERDESILKALAAESYHTGTATDDGMYLANAQLGEITDARREEASQTVVVFSDGAPHSSTWSDSACGEYANYCLASADTTKNIYGANIFSVLLYTGTPPTNLVNFMEGLSSDYPNAKAYNNLGTRCDDEDVYGENATPAVYYHNAGDDLSGVFKAIAKQSGGSSNTALSESTSTIDVVSSSFALSGVNSASDIKLYTAPYLFNEDTGELYFGTETLAPCSGGEGPDVGDKYDKYIYQTIDGKQVKVLDENSPYDVDDDIEIDEEALADDMIKVTGFDYSNNWCGPQKSGDVITGAHGHKLTILIPIEMAEDAVGGPGIQTNAPGSGIFAPNTTEPLVPFVSPNVSLPVNISVKKQNLQKGESAKFMIQRTTLPITSNSTWTYVTSIFVTKTDANTDPVVNIKGLPSTAGEGQDYVYRVVEEDWSWTYEFDGATGKGLVKVDGVDVVQDITINDKYGVTTDKFVTNPIIFKNRLKDENVNVNVRHAESKATNTFIPKSSGSTSGVVRYDDTKNRPE